MYRILAIFAIKLVLSSFPFHHHHHHHHDHYSTHITADLGWYLFPYNSMGVGYFTANLTSISTVTLTGCYCPGDVVELIDNGFPITAAVNCAVSQPTTIGGTCDAPVLDNFACLESEGFCGVSGIIPPGQHNFTTIVSRSSYNYNQAAIRIDTYCLQDNDVCCAYWQSLPNGCVNAVVG